MAAAARTVDGSGVDRIGQQGNEVSANQLLDVRRRLQLHQAGELAVSTDGLRAHRDGADRAGRFSHGLQLLRIERPGLVVPNTPLIRKCRWTACAEACQPLVSAAEADPSVSSEFRQ